MSEFFNINAAFFSWPVLIFNLIKDSWILVFGILLQVLGLILLLVIRSITNKED